MQLLALVIGDLVGRMRGRRGPEIRHVGARGPRPVELAYVERVEPFPGFLYQVREADRAYGSGSISERALRNGVLEAAERKDWSKEDAEELGAAMAESRRLQLVFWDLVLAGWWNDLIYGTWGNARGEHVGPHGRTIRLHKQHPDNRRRISQGLPPMRNIQLLEAGTDRRAKAIDRAWALELPFLLMPRLNTGRLLRGQVTTKGVQWRDGSSAISPPPIVRRLGWATVDAPDERRAA